MYARDQDSANDGENSVEQNITPARFSNDQQEADDSEDDRSIGGSVADNMEVENIEGENAGAMRDTNRAVIIYYVVSGQGRSELRRANPAQVDEQNGGNN